MKLKRTFYGPVLRYLVIFVASLLVANRTHAQDEIQYVAYLSEKDHYNSNGDRLKSVADILRQDRANYHKGRGDRADEDDGGIFDSPEGRTKFQSHAIVLESLKSASLIAEPQGVIVRVKGRRIYVSGVE